MVSCFFFSVFFLRDYSGILQAEWFCEGQKDICQYIGEEFMVFQGRMKVGWIRSGVVEIVARDKCLFEREFCCWKIF